MADAAYGLWPLVVLNTLLFVVFAASFFHPKSKRDWRAMGAYSAFLVALFTEMYGIPLTIYLLGSWLGSQFPLLKDTHAGGHLWNDLTGWSGDPHLSPFHLASYIAIGTGFWLIAAAWKRLHEAVQHEELATAGPYAWVRHPQYDGFLLIMIGFLLQWPTIPTLIMFPVLVYVYVRLARSEEREVAKEFGEQWDAYAARTPAFLPRHRPGRNTAPRPGPTPQPGSNGSRRARSAPTTPTPGGADDRGDSRGPAGHDPRWCSAVLAPGRASPSRTPTRPEVTEMDAAGLLTWLLLALQVLTTAAGGVLLARRGKRDAAGLDRSIRRTAPALLIAGVLPLPALLATDAPAGAWGLWGAGYVAAALVYAFVDTLRDTHAAQDAAAAGRMP